MSEKIDIKHIAKLSRLELTKEEEGKYSQQLTGVLEYAQKIGDFRSPEPSEGSLDFARDDKEERGRDDTIVANVGIINGVTDVMREDEVMESLPREQALNNAPAQKDGFIAVKAVFNNED